MKTYFEIWIWITFNPELLQGCQNLIQSGFKSHHLPSTTAMEFGLWEWVTIRWWCRIRYCMLLCSSFITIEGTQGREFGRVEKVFEKNPTKQQTKTNDKKNQPQANKNPAEIKKQPPHRRCIFYRQKNSVRSLTEALCISESGRSQEVNGFPFKRQRQF